MTIDLVSGAEIPPLGVVPTPAMIMAGAEVLDDELGPAGPYHDRIARLVWRAMEHARQAVPDRLCVVRVAAMSACDCGGIIQFDDESGIAFCPDCKSRERYTYNKAETDSFRPPGYRNASEDEPERDAGMRQSEP